jgi:hypothetical protein
MEEHYIITRMRFHFLFLPHSRRTYVGHPVLCEVLVGQGVGK